MYSKKLVLSSILNWFHEQDSCPHGSRSPSKILRPMIDRYREISIKEKFSFSLIGQEGMDLVEPDYFLRPVPFWFSHHLTKNKQSSVSSAPSSSSKATSSSSSTTATSSSWLMQHCRYHHHLHQHHHHQIIFPLKGAAATDKPLVLHSLAQQTVNHEIHILIMMNFIYWVQSRWQWGWLLSFGRGDGTKQVYFLEKSQTAFDPHPSFLENHNAIFFLKSPL